MKYIDSSLTDSYRKRKVTVKNTDKSIAVMLDLDGVADNINENTAEIFIEYLNIIRKKFGAKHCFICISTHATDVSLVKSVLDILNYYRTRSIVFGKCFLYGSSYDYVTDKVTLEGPFFNTNKITTFKNYYLNNYITNNMWFMVADDSLDSDLFKNFKDIHPCLFVKPGGNGTSNFMSIEPKTKGFDAVIEALEMYISYTKGLDREDILNEQKNMIYQLTNSELIEKVRSNDYEFLIRYFESDYVNEFDYYDVVVWLDITAVYNEQDFDKVSYLLNILKSHITEEQGKSRICSLEEKWGIR